MVLRQCTVCGRRFTKTEHFKRHERSHTRERPYRCSVCDKAFSRSDVLFRHMKCHTQKTEGDDQQKPAERRSTISEGVAPVPAQPNQQPQSKSLDQPTNDNNHQPNSGIPLMQILSPSNYLGPQENGLPAARARHGSMDMPSSYIDPRQNQHRQDHISIPADWVSHSPVSQMNNPANPHRQSPSQRSADASTFDTSMSGSHQPAQTPQSDLPPNSYGTNALDWLPQGNMGQGDFHDPFQMWLFPSLGDLDQSPDFLQTYGTGATPNFSLPEPKVGPDGQQISQERTKNINKVPRERFSRVQKCWASRPHRLHRMMPNLWRDIIGHQVDNLFSDSSESPPHPKAGSNWGLDADCRYRLRDAFRTPAPSALHSPRIQSITPFEPMMNNDSSIFPPAEILDIAMGLFFRHFHPTVPFIHVPTFSVNNTPSPLLFVICLIGLSILGTTGATRFVSRMFPSFLQRVSADLAACTSGTATSPQQLTYLATALLTLHLAAMTGDKDTIAQSQMLYVSTLALMQQNGLFSACDGGDLNALISDLHDSEHHWKAWSRIESTKRLILSTLALDSWYGALLFRAPIVRSEAVKLYAPCAEPLFQAKSATQFQSLIRGGKLTTAPTFQISDLHANPTPPSSPLGFLGSSTLLALLQIQSQETYHRLMPADPLSLGSLIPWQLYASDLKARSLIPAVLGASALCGPTAPPPHHDTNTLVLWHALCNSLLADFRMFELAAGRHGAGPATGALESISAWTQTPSARRAVVHAAQTHRLMERRRVSDHVSVGSVVAVFGGALVLGLYLFMVPQASNHANRTTVELADVDIDWAELGELGFTDDSLGSNHDGGTTGGADPSPVAHFVRYGGTVALNGVPHQGGYESARRVLLDFANLMDGISGRKLRTFTQVLHIMSDDLMNVDAGL
ncbi:uncharacterized protein HMPREF1541_00444 [Cyphellophora europaea CBS 101466]|uniref:C2H2-type domain-containing protein n=1 Tax=Cyphellophora europaea (strain CBS 101466) TaxID=1220924 RepID=W2SCC5_CYPE1|nr:uncharacterized protein HMPREF1541_00444 [Cyphellophora europaea CBS 101466]ETN46260.1 hypothetical protein HMPREF1541_00444 [Cyphellophora europaea CBS 101466]